jgi:hypothetical protein
MKERKILNVDNIDPALEAQPVTIEQLQQAADEMQNTEHKNAVIIVSSEALRRLIESGKKLKGWES